MSLSKTAIGDAIVSEEENDRNFKTPMEVSEPVHINGMESKNELISEITSSPIGKVHTRSRSKTPNANIPPESNDTNDTKLNNQDSPKHRPNTRSRSKTPQNKPEEISPATSVPDDTDLIIDTNDVNLASVITDDVSPLEIDLSILEKEAEEEALPELQFDENEIDVESEGSPNRCTTRRSQATTVSTPKTPKLNDGGDFVIVDLNDTQDSDVSDSHTSDSLDNISTTAVVGSDITKNDSRIMQDTDIGDEKSYASPDRNISLRETIRNISTRRTIRSVNAENFRKFALQNNRNKSNDIHSPIPNYDLVERVAGVKRKSSSVQFNEPKKFKESVGLLSYITLPIYNLKNSFITKNKPKMEEKQSDLNKEGYIKIEVDREETSERKWCSIM